MHDRPPFCYNIYTNRRFSDILRAHETQDDATCGSEEAFEAAVRKEFANAGELLRAAREAGVTVSSVLSRGLPDGFPVLPVRRADRFDIRKHTMSQRPYMHANDFYELICVLRGSCTQSFPDGSALTLTAGQMCLLRPGSVHALMRCCAGDVILKAVIPAPAFPGFFPDGDTVTAFPKAGEQAEYFAVKLLGEHMSGGKCAAEATACWLNLLLIELMRGPGAGGGETEEKLNAYLAAHVRDASLTGFASCVGYSAGYAARTVKEKTGRSFSEALAAYRLRRAAELLETTDMPVDAVAEEAGYSGASGLYKRFCSHYGMTPRAYRKMFG